VWQVHVEAVEHGAGQDHDEGQEEEDDGGEHAAVMPLGPGGGKGGREGGL
jgi:hypothetical protein